MLKELFHHFNVYASKATSTSRIGSGQLWPSSLKLSRAVQPSDG